jgi:hypothetical protein
MAITMQGSWIVRVKSKSARFQQRFIINGASYGNGIYAGDVSTPDVWVTGNQWTITVQNNPGTGFTYSKEQIKFPVVSGGYYYVDIQSDDGGVSVPDSDFNDLILTCYTPVTDEDFLVYGNISHYSDGCIFNPCYPRHIVIDKWKGLYDALKIPHLKEVIERLYPERTWRIPHFPDPDPEPFRPIVIPLSGELPVPDKKYQVIQVARQELTGDQKKKKNADFTSMQYNSVKSVQEKVLWRQESESSIYQIDKAKLGSIFDRVRINCETGHLANALIKFYEYDRTSAELGGGAYSGSGNREYLGIAQADLNGNYLFRFKRSIAQFVTEAITDVAPGEDEVQQSMPDLILCLVDPFDTSKVLYESACYWNIPLLKRINLCIPRGSAGLIPQPCDGQSVIQRVGNIVLGPLNTTTGTRIGSGNYLTADGIISAYHYLAPQVRCAAWSGNLAIWGCLKNKDIKWYTIRYRPYGASAWTMHASNFTLPKYIYPLGVPVLIDAFVGPVTKALKLNTSALVDCQAYLNVETEADPNWMNSMRSLKAFLNSAALIAVKGSVEVRLEGFTDAGNKLADEIVTLYIDNAGAEAAIDPDVTMAGVTLGNCALFTLPTDVNNVTDENAPITVRFKAIQNSGFMNAYELYMYKGATGSFAVTPGVIPADFSGGSFMDNTPNRGRTYQHLSSLDCHTKFKGTVSEITADGDGFYTVVLTPAGNWLEPDQTFCAFSLNLDGTIRHTDGSSGYSWFGGGQVLIGIQR